SGSPLSAWEFVMSANTGGGGAGSGRRGGAAAGRGRGREDHAARVRFSHSSGLHPGAQRPQHAGRERVPSTPTAPDCHATRPVNTYRQHHEHRNMTTLGLLNIGVVATGVLAAPRLEAESIFVERGLM